MSPIITIHAKKRIKERTGLCKRCQHRHVQNVLKKGKYLFRNITDKKFHMQFNGREYVFGWTGSLQPVLITVKYTKVNGHLYKREHHDHHLTEGVKVA